MYVLIYVHVYLNNFIVDENDVTIATLKFNVAVQC